MLSVRYHPTTRHLRLSAAPEEFSELAAAVRAGPSAFSCADVGDHVVGDDVDPAFALAVLSLEPTADPATRVTLRVENPGLVIRGGHDHLALLARDFEQLAHSEPDESLDLAWFPGHAYLTASSLATTLTLTR